MQGLLQNYFLHGMDISILPRTTKNAHKINIHFQTTFIGNQIINVLIKILQANSFFVGGTRRKMTHFNLSALRC